MQELFEKVRDSVWAPVALVVVCAVFGIWIVVKTNKDDFKTVAPPVREQPYVLLSIRHPETKGLLLQFRVEFDTQPVVGDAKWLNTVFYVQDKAQAWADSVYLEHKKYMENQFDVHPVGTVPLELTVPGVFEKVKQKARR